MGAVIEQIALQKKKQDLSHFSITVPFKEHRSFLCFKTPRGWHCGDFDNNPEQTVKVVQLNANKTQTLLLDEKNEFVEHSGVIISAYVLPESDFLLHAEDKKNINYYKNNIIAVEFLFYLDCQRAIESTNNSFTIVGNINLHHKPHELLFVNQGKSLLFGL